MFRQSKNIKINQKLDAKTLINFFEKGVTGSGNATIFTISKVKGIEIDNEIKISQEAHLIVESICKLKNALNEILKHEK